MHIELWAGKFEKASITIKNCPDVVFSGVPGPHGARGNKKSHSKAVWCP